MSKELLINKIKEVANKIANNEKLTITDSTFAKNALLEYAAKLEKRSAGITKAREANAIPEAQGQRDYINLKRWEKHYKKLAGSE